MLIHPNESTPKPVGRRELSFADSSQDTKRRKIARVLQFNSPGRVRASGMQLLRQDGFNVGPLISYMRASGATPRMLIQAHSESKRKFSPLESLKLLVSCKLAKRPYTHLASSLGFLSGRNIIARYNEVKEDKTACLTEIASLTDVDVRSHIK